jgi:hypothetical protein
MKIKEAPAEGKTIFEYAAGSNGADDYSRLVGAFLGDPVPREYEAAI